MELRFWIDLSYRDPYSSIEGAVYIITADEQYILGYNPSDGYRSSCDEILMDSIQFWLKIQGKALNEYLVHYDEIEYKTRIDIKEESGWKRKVFYYIIAKRKGRVVFSIGTDVTDDYYPRWIWDVEGKDYSPSSAFDELVPLVCAGLPTKDEGMP